MPLQVKDSRLRSLIETGIGAAISKVIAMMAPLVTTPLLLSYLGMTDYGLWMILVSVTTMLSVSDLGIANGITNELTRNANNAEKARPLICNAYIALFGVFASIFVMLAISYYSIQIFDELTKYKNQVLIVISVLLPFSINVPLGLIQRLLLIDKRGGYASLLPICAAILSVVVVYIAVYFELSSFIVVFLFSMTVPVVNMVASLTFFKYIREDWRPSVTDMDSSEILKIIKSGRQFLLLSTLVLIAGQTDYAVVASVLSVEDVVPYSIANRIIGIASATVSMMGTALWPMFSEAIRKNELVWIGQTIRKLSIITILIYLVFLLFILIFYAAIVATWLGQEIPISKWILFYLIGLSMLTALSSPYFMVLNSLMDLRFQMLIYSVLIFISVPAKYFLGLKYGVSAIAAIGFFSWLLFILPVVSIRARMKLRHLS